jgi:prevent-host-death family protein
MATITTLTSREFQQNATLAQRAAERGPVFITKRGRVVNVLLSIDVYHRMSAGRAGTIDRLGLPVGIEAIEVEFPRSPDLPRPADFT